MLKQQEMCDRTTGGCGASGAIQKFLVKSKRLSKWEIETSLAQVWK